MKKIYFLNFQIFLLWLNKRGWTICQACCPFRKEQVANRLHFFRSVIPIFSSLNSLVTSALAKWINSICQIDPQVGLELFFVGVRKRESNEETGNQWKQSTFVKNQFRYICVRSLDPIPLFLRRFIHGEKDQNMTYSTLYGEWLLRLLVKNYMQLLKNFLGRRKLYLPKRARQSFWESASFW